MASPFDFRLQWQAVQDFDEAERVIDAPLPPMSLLRGTTLTLARIGKSAPAHLISEETFHLIRTGKFHEYARDWEQLILCILPQGLVSDLQELLSQKNGQAKKKKSKAAIPKNLKAEIVSYKKAPADCDLLKDRVFSMPYNPNKFDTARQRTILSYPSKAPVKKSATKASHKPDSSGEDSQTGDSEDDADWAWPNDTTNIQDIYSPSLAYAREVWNSEGLENFMADVVPWPFGFEKEGFKKDLFEHKAGGLSLKSIRPKLQSWFKLLVEGEDEDSQAVVIIAGRLLHRLHEQLYADAEERVILRMGCSIIIIRRPDGTIKDLLLRLDHPMLMTNFSMRPLPDCFMNDFALRMCQTLMGVDFAKSSSAGFVLSRVGIRTVVGVEFEVAAESSTPLADFISMAERFGFVKMPFETRLGLNTGMGIGHGPRVLRGKYNKTGPGPKPFTEYESYKNRNKNPARNDVYANPEMSAVFQKAADRPDENARRAGIKYIWKLERPELTLVQLELLVRRESSIKKLKINHGVEVDVTGLSDEAGNAVVQKAAEDAQRKQKKKKADAAAAAKKAQK